MEGAETVATSQTALGNLKDASGDLRPSFAVFQDQIEKVRREALRVRSEADLMRQQSTAYCTARQSDVRTISNEEMRQAAEQRAEEVRESCDQVNVMYDDVNAAFAVYLRNLDDLQTYLSNELNYPALHSASRWVNESHASADQLRGSIQRLTTELNRTSNKISPVPLPATQGQETYAASETAKRPQVAASAP